MSKRLEGKVAIVTGGSNGIGFATAKRFAAEGAQVVITGRRERELAEAAQRIGPGTLAVVGDVAKLADLDRLVEAVKARHDHVDVLFANAGVYQPSPLGQIDEAHFDRHFDTNVKGLLFTVQKLLPLMRNGASILLNASVAASKAFAGLSVYAATKAAVRSFARGWTLDLKERGIRVNAISPGPIETEGFAAVAPTPNALAQIKQGFVSAVPLGRMGSADEVANVALFLASDESRFVTGAEYFVDGGVAQV